MTMAFLLTTRGIPQIYYGTEILMKGMKSDGDGKLRLDFPGGWADDKRNAFTAEGRTKKENEAWNFLQTILKYRKGSDVLANGKLKQFVPEDNIYVYFRYNSSKTVMVILNINKLEKTLKTNRFIEATKGFTKGHDIITGNDFDIQSEITLAPNSATILELIP